MRYAVGVLLICSLFSSIITENASNQSLVDGLHDDAPSNMLISQVRRERKERRLLRKKKQKLRELREEIRALTMSLHQMHDEHSTETESKRKKKDRRDHKGVKWRKNLLDKLKIIVRRLDRMERRIINVKTFLPFDIANSTVLFTAPSTSTATSAPSNVTLNSKIKRIQPAITRSRSGENGTACTAHKDCRPGHCCHHIITKSNDSTICVMHGLAEHALCIDSCQCSTQLSCFLPEGNLTEAFCKKAASVDVLEGSYLYRKDSIIVDV